MTSSPLDYSKKACQFVIEQITEQDLLSMVAHSRCTVRDKTNAAWERTEAI